jgi:hypothetical protein
MRNSAATESAKITAHYADMCFCTHRPDLGAAEITPLSPRFNFKKAARRLADRLHLVDVRFNEIDRSAVGVLGVACVHRPEQRVRLVWTFHYPEAQQ